ncbi:hypothetical protein INS49_006945 [Diaporthe citri]|uniref:uncharacterized protein n=1 Tax=Diaporthe citri TaxID=83186 RepID=UPI001C7E9AB4|nr:uncharacterized protein INS49_006945 [Diaporthe citri]KAG6365335.1 hypothetical protein INS49_006945 [Diaporthe citri]
MASSRAIKLMHELMQEVGVAGALLPTKDGGLEAQLSLNVSNIPEEVLQDIFLSAPTYSSVPASKKRKVQPEDDEDEVDQDGDDRQELAVRDGANLDEEEPLKMYNEKSGRQCFKHRPDIFTTKGKLKREYAYIAAGNKKPKLGGPGGSNGRITNRPWVKVIDIDGLTTDVASFSWLHEK